MNPAEQFIAESLFSLTGTAGRGLATSRQRPMAEFLNQVDEDRIRFPKEADSPVWNLVVDDEFSTALYLLAVLLDEERTILQMGAGAATELIRCCDSLGAAGPENIPKELADRFTSSAPREVSTTDFRHWCQ